MASSDPETPVDSLLTVAEDLVPSRLEKPETTISLDFSGLLYPPLTLRQDLTEGCGGKTWPAGMVLAKYLLRYKLDEMRGKNMFVRSSILWALLFSV